MKPDLRVCFISSYPPNRGRLSEYAQSLVREIAKRPAVGKVFVLADTVSGSEDKVVESRKVEVLRVWHPDRPFSVFKILWSLLLLKPDVVHFNLHFRSFGGSRLSNFFGFSLVLFSRLFGLRSVVLLHNLAEKADLEKLEVKMGFVNRVGLFLAMRFVLSGSTLVVPVRSYVGYLRDRYGHRSVRYIPHGTYVSDHLSVNHAEKVVLVFGHMSPSKGLPVIFRAFEGMSKEVENVRLVVAGGSHPNFPYYLGRISKVAPSNTVFLGYVPEVSVAKVFDSADVVVLPYLAATGTSGVFHLACGFGKPIVASALPEIKELVGQKSFALLVPPGDSNALRAAITRVLYSEDLAAKMAFESLAFAEGERWGSVAEAYEAEYLKLFFAR